MTCASTAWRSACCAPTSSAPAPARWCRAGCMPSSRRGPSSRCPTSSSCFVARRPTLLHPDSRGEILLRSGDPREAPRIAYNFFSAPNDLPRLREGFKRAREVAYQAPMAPYRGRETSPGDAVKTDAEIDAFIRRTAITAHHPCGTCAMGTTPDTVTDPELRVRGVEHLRVVDASVMPDLVSAHINACVLMIAEKASDMIRKQTPLPADNAA